MLTDDEINAMADEYLENYRIAAGCALNFGRDVEAAVLAKQNLAGYSVTCDGEHFGNLFFSKQNAHHECDRLDAAYPGYKRQVVAVYSTGEPHAD